MLKTHALRAILLTTLSCINLVQPAPQHSQAPLRMTEVEHTLRPLSEYDLDDFVTTYIDAFKPGPVWQYLYHDVEKYINYTWTCTRKILQEQWEEFKDTNTSIVNVITVSTDDRQDSGRREKVVSLAVWNWLKPQEALSNEHSPFSIAAHLKCSDHLDINMTRAEDYSRQALTAMERYIGNLSEPQLYLNLLATHPDWDGHGFGAEQVEVGLAKATLAEMPATLLATGAGYPLYDSLGFHSLANITIQTLDDFPIIWFEYMRWDAEQ